MLRRRVQFGQPSTFATPGDGYTGGVWIVLVLAASVAVLVGWRLFLVARHRPDSSRPVDSGHPHLTDVDPHDAP